MSAILVGIVALLVGLDQLVKYLIVVYLKPVGSVTVIPKILSFTYLENDGAAFSIFAGKQIFLIVLTSVALLAWAYFLLFKRPKQKLELIGMVLVLAGGIGNLIDRIANGFVVDYVEFLFVRFAVFNLADIFVTVGFVLLFIGVFMSESKKKKEEKANKDDTPTDEKVESPSIENKNASNENTIKKENKEQLKTENTHGNS